MYSPSDNTFSKCLRNLVIIFGGERVRQKPFLRLKKVHHYEFIVGCIVMFTCKIYNDIRKILQSSLSQIYCCWQLKVCERCMMNRKKEGYKNLLGTLKILFSVFMQGKKKDTFWVTS